MDHHIRIPQEVSGRLVSKRPISLSRAAKLISRFAAVENGSSPAVSLYLQRTADAFNHLVQSRDKRSKAKNPDAPGSERAQTEEDSEKAAREREKEIVDGGDAAEAPAKRKSKKNKRGSGEENVESKSTPTEKDSENLVRERETDVVNEGDAAGTPKKKTKTKKSNEASSDSKNIQTEIKTEIINAAAEAEAPSKKKKKKSGESGSTK